MYKLGTTLIFTSLTQASAAADLFGAHNLKSYGRIIGWEHGFVAAACSVYSGGDAEISERWELALDTEEKCKWFVPQVWDKGYIEYTDGHKVHGIFMNEYTIEPYNIYPRITTQFFGKVKAVIESRQGKPFPTPQKVIEP